MGPFEKQVEAGFSPFSRQSLRLDGIEKETGLKLWNRFSKAVQKTLDRVPAASPIELQITQSFITAGKAMKPHLKKTGVDAVNALLSATKGHFLSDYAVLSGLVRKYNLDVNFNGSINQIPKQD